MSRRPAPAAPRAGPPPRPASRPGARIALLVALGLSLALPPGCDRGARRPNVLLITLDTVRADHLGCYGYADHPTTPRLDALAAESVLFVHSFANSSFTPPSHGSLMTGLYPEEHGLTHWSRALASVDTAAELFGRAGYRTVAVTPLRTLFQLGLERGFETRIELPHAVEGDVLRLADAESVNAAVLPALTNPSDAPFFAWVHYYDAHRVYGRQGPEWAGRFSAFPDAEVGATESWYRLDADDRRRLGITPQQARHIADRYDGGLAYLDRHVGVLLDRLREAGVLDGTLVVITADHGEVLDEHDEEWFSHDPYLLEENLRVPLIVRLPGGRAAGRQVGALVQGVDVLPTVLDLAGVPAGDATFSGTSLAPLLSGEPLRRDAVLASRSGGAADGAPAAAAASRDLQRSLRTATHKLLHHVDRGTLQLFAVEDEHRDLSAAQPAALAALRRLYAERVADLRLAGDASDAGLDEETRRLLCALGYLDDCP